ncbi:MAG: 3'-5' exonuclease [Candidatus Borkfalkiaceae bacterium]|nr:3'-5' exonuclease [Christensenellaceae bacterium]
MRYLFFDIECANCYLGKAKIYSFGYVITDENFNMIGTPEDILVNPACNFDPYVKKNILAYDKKIFKTLPKFSEVYPRIRDLLTADDVVCFGYGIQNDLRFLEDDCARYRLPEIKATVFDIQKLIELVDNKKAKKLDAEYVERTGSEERGTHRSDEDAVRTAEVAKAICKTQSKKLHEFFLESDGSVKVLPELFISNGEMTVNPFKTAQWIWVKTDCNVDDYAEFYVKLPETVKTAQKITLKYSSDSAFAAFIGDRLVAFSQCADYTDCKYFDCKDLSKPDAFNRSLAEMRVQVWHYGADSANYIKADGGVIFELECDGEVVAYSSESTPARVMNEYKNGYKKNISGQLGFSFLYDNRAPKGEYTNSVLIDKTMVFHHRGRKSLVVLPPAKCTPRKTVNSLIIDLYAEICGFLYLDIDASSDIKLTVAYGEHLLDGGHVRRLVGDRDFSVEVVLKKGKNVYLNPFRRLAGRYLEIFAEQAGEQNAPRSDFDLQSAKLLDQLKINYIGLRPVEYPVVRKNLRFKDKEVQKIADICVNSLRVCMHEHYEDCAWREQGLYSLDSRNQALCGYYAFLGHDYQRSNIILLSRGLRADGLLSLTVPGGIDYPIPFFSLVYFQTVYEYIEHTGKRAILDIVAPVLKKIYATFESQICDNGLIARFSPAPYWNFYEWTDGMDGWESDMTAAAQNRQKEEVFDAPLNLAFILATEFYDKIFGEKHNLDKMKKAVKDRFYDKERGEFVISDKDKKSSALVTALAILAGLGGKADTEKMLGGNQVAASLSTKAFVYDALLKVGGYEQYIIDDIKRVYGKMLDAGATTVWETEHGAADFGGAGSLCHGWSAVPIYYFCKILKKKDRPAKNKAGRKPSTK